VIVPFFQQRDTLARCLECLRESRYPAELLEVVLVDNHPEPTLRPGDLPDIGIAIRLVHEPVAGSYRARNRGVRACSGEVLAFTDADCAPDPDWIPKGVTHLSCTPECGLVGGKIEILLSNPSRPTAPEVYEHYTALRQADYLRRERFAATANLFTTRAVFEAVGPFDARLRSSGDVEWGRRVFAAGYRQVFAAGALVRHPARRTLAELVYRCRRIAGGRLQIARLSTDRWAARLSLYRKTLAQAWRYREAFGTVKMIQVLGIGFLLRFVEWGEKGRCRLGAEPLR
jgi:GT2 family glycosyltransferase